MHRQQTSKAMLVTALLMFGLAMAPGVAGHHNAPTSTTAWTCHRTVEEGDSHFSDCGSNPHLGGTRYVVDGETMDFENDGPVGLVGIGNEAYVQVTHYAFATPGPVVFSECIPGPLPGGTGAVTSSGTWTVPPMTTGEWFQVEWFESCEQLTVTKSVQICLDPRAGGSC